MTYSVCSEDHVGDLASCALPPTFFLPNVTTVLWSGTPKNVVMISNTALTLVTGTRYLVHISVKNPAGVVTKSASNGVVIDTVLPMKGKVYDGLEGSQYIDVEVASGQLSKVEASWVGFYDTGSGVDRFEVCVGVTKGLGCEVTNFEDVGKANTFSHVLSAPQKTKILNSNVYYVTVRCVDIVGLSASVSSNGVVVDVTPPSSFGVVNNLNASTAVLEANSDREADLHTLKNELLTEWEESTDADTGISHYEIGIGTKLNCGTLDNNCDVVPFTRVTSNTRRYHFVGLDLNLGIELYVVVKAVNGALGQQRNSSKPFIIDTTAPAVPSNPPALHLDVSEGSVPAELVELLAELPFLYHGNMGQLALEWDLFVDPELITNITYEWFVRFYCCYNPVHFPLHIFIAYDGDPLPLYFIQCKLKDYSIIIVNNSNTCIFII